MDLVNQYLRVVAALLPRAQRDDIVNELRDTILTTIEAREAQLGRTLTQDEIEAILREIGHPIVIAARYREGPQHVVGPALYPYWMFAVKIVIAIQLAILAIVVLVRLASGVNFGEAVGHAIGDALTGAIGMVGLATIAAWLIERQKVKIASLDNWRVRDLRVLEYAGWDLEDLGRGFSRARRSSARYAGRADRDAWRAHVSPIGRGIAAVAWGTVFLMWWTGAFGVTLIGSTEDLGKLGLATGALANVDWESFRRLTYVPVTAFAAAVIIHGVLMLLLPRAVRLRGAADVVIGIAGLVLVGWFWTVSPLAPAVQVESLSAFLVRVKTAFQNSPPLDLAPILTLVLACSAFGALCQVLRGLWGMLAPVTAQDSLMTAR